ncbi:hypothetical protein GCM10007981_10450 [Thermocladium modestius]|uniref:Pyrimidine dimer DNA glycosylase n=1 Tax=Thermocladium modestius TaxID=62609 RepID=A0A830GWT5_9CREN|nr:pyrimidine dimer DNA glycosylase/endonuclease V [Thermocladium modestius]GGP20822.1 hypothetical protein GCM10007981_10450 [Thermocladium modestius]
MRLWSIHPEYLDARGLLGLWREALLAQSVLLNESVGTNGYRNHPQLIRFKESRDPILSIGTYLHHVHAEGERRGYRFDKSRIERYDEGLRLPVKRGQVDYEFNHLLGKLRERDRGKYEQLKGMKNIKPHPLFYIVEGGIEKWEKTKH